MRTTRIDIEGKDGYYASITRKKDTDWIDIEILTPDVIAGAAVPADSADEQRIAARHMFRELNGRDANASEADQYFRVIETLAD